LPFKSVRDLIELTGDGCDFKQCERDDPNRWMLIHVGQYGERNGYSVAAPPSHLIAFETLPGDGCGRLKY